MFLAKTYVSALVTLVMQLYEARSKLSFKHTETVVSKLIFHTVETAAVTAIVSLVWLVLYTTMSNTFLAVPSVYMTGKLYSPIIAKD